MYRPVGPYCVPTPGGVPRDDLIAINEGQYSNRYKTQIYRAQAVV